MVKQESKIIAACEENVSSIQRTFLESNSLNEPSNLELNLTKYPSECSEKMNKDLFIKDLEIQILSEQISLKNKIIDIKNKKILKKNQVITRKNHEILSLKKSTSWKITKPIRLLSSGLKLLRKFTPKSQKFNLTNISDQLNNNNFDKNNFKEWTKLYDEMTDEKRSAIRTLIKNLDSSPKISVILPTYNANADWLVEAVQSIQNQLYTNWELCIADDASTNNDIKLTLQTLAKQDERIKLVLRETNGHISASSNSAIKLATGDWLALFDHDDILPEDALFWVADAIVKNPNAGIVYSDECTINNLGDRVGHYFKCDWNYDLFLSHNLISHLGVYRRDLVSQVSGFRIGLEGSQDHDLALRVVELLKPEQIIHIPRVLYHWRIHSGSTASDISAKPYALNAGVKAIQDHLDRQKIKAKVSYTNFHQYRVQYEIPNKEPLVSIIIVNCNNLLTLQKCLLSILKNTTYSNYEILLIDNNIKDNPTLEYFRKISNLKNIRILKDDRQFNYAALNNTAVKEANGEFILLLKDDTEVITPDWLTEMVSIAIQPGVGAVGARLLYPNNTLQHAGVIFGIGDVAGYSHRLAHKDSSGYLGRAKVAQSISAVLATCLLVSKKIYQDAGSLDEINLYSKYYDLDFCLTLTQKGYRNIWTPYAELYNHASELSNTDHSSVEQETLEKSFLKSKWGNKLLEDPYYSLNLTLDSEDFTLAWPPRIKDITK